MSSRTQWILYSIARIVLFLGVFAILMLLRVDLWISGFAAAIIALCVSYIFIKQPQRAPKPEKPDTDATAEDAAVDESAAEGSALERDRGSESKPE